MDGASFDHQGLILGLWGGETADLGRWWNVRDWIVCTRAKRKPGTVPVSTADLHRNLACLIVFPDSIRYVHVTSWLMNYCHSAWNDDLRSLYPTDVMKQRIADLGGKDSSMTPVD